MVKKMTLRDNNCAIKWDKHSPTNIQSNRYKVKYRLLYYTIKKREVQFIMFMYWVLTKY